MDFTRISPPRPLFFGPANRKLPASRWRLTQAPWLGTCGATVATGWAYVTFNKYMVFSLQHGAARVADDRDRRPKVQELRFPVWARCTRRKSGLSLDLSQPAV